MLQPNPRPNPPAHMPAPLPCYVTVGRGTYFADITFFRWGWENIKIGNYCSLSKQIKLIAGGNHRTDTVSTYPFDTMLMGNTAGTMNDRSYGKGQNGIDIGNDVWIGFGASIMGQAKIGHGAVIAANATVLTNIPPYAIAVGNPARVTKYRFSEETIDRLLKIAWWDWPEEVIKANADKFYIPVGEFVEQFSEVGAVSAMKVGIRQ